MRVAFPTAWRDTWAIDRPRLLILGVLTGGHTVVHWYTQLLPLVLPSLKADLNLSDVQVGGITSTQMGVSSFTNLPSGYLADSFRPHVASILAAAIIAFGLAGFVLGLAPTYAWALIGAGLIGLGTSLWHPDAMGSLSLRFPDRRGMALSVHGVGASVGDIVHLPTLALPQIR